MNKIYVVVESWGEYDDAQEALLKGYTCSIRAHEALESLRAADQLFRARRTKFEELFRPLAKALAGEPLSSPSRPKQPHGIKKKDWPQSYFDALQQYEKEQALVVQLVNVRNAFIEATFPQEAHQILNELGVPQEDRARFGAAPYFHSYDRDSRYRVEELEVE